MPTEDKSILLASQLVIIGSLLGLASFLAFYAGMMGILYKVIADGVSVGVQAANKPSTEPDTTLAGRD